MMTGWLRSPFGERSNRSTAPMRRPSASTAFAARLARAGGAVSLKLSISPTAERLRRPGSRMRSPLAGMDAGSRPWRDARACELFVQLGQKPLRAAVSVADERRGLLHGVEDDGAVVDENTMLRASHDGLDQE
jgi:hypothetical protein